MTNYHGILSLAKTRSLNTEKRVSERWRGGRRRTGNFPKKLNC